MGKLQKLKFMARLGQFLMGISFILLALFRENILIPLLAMILGLTLHLTGKIMIYKKR